MIESGMSGAGVLADLFLKLGSKFQSADVSFEIETLHAIHIFIAGVATTVIAGIALVKFCKST